MSTRSFNVQALLKKLDFNKLNGLVPVVTVDVSTGRVLMLAFMDKEALIRTAETGLMHYWSRSRGKLWLKGEESGHYQKVVGVYVDCDNDSLLFLVEQVGVACHKGRPSCFHCKVEDGTKEEELGGGGSILSQLQEVIDLRLKEKPEGSYTWRLASKGLQAVLKKVHEELFEFTHASLLEDEEKVVAEAADLLYHLMLALSLRSLSIEDVMRELTRRRYKEASGSAS
ncbi:MAG: bifunctional phosphoribosyl-AMP cyclohydrolase/phosphoribosyl-ATP diphosphatase HisIE [Candidatus Nezhaarchaeota archaeon]|nr:bifunctional phosphoribosyl-AMP cyclohydrolase/phosphoribosyl-ATP diphosphatase HisIE [Candidatus Nezhaarchaeota archaeon]